MGQGVRIERLTGDQLERHLPELARLRILVFREWPYLYEGSLEYEQRYMRIYTETPDAVIVGALDGDRLVGAATALPLAAEPDSLSEPLRQAGYDVAKIFYFGESVLERSYRGQGIGVAFFNEREAWARSRGGYDHACFCGVIRDPNDPRRPPDYVPLDQFWQRRGFTKLDGVTGTLSWQEIGEADETPKQMQFWLKTL